MVPLTGRIPTPCHLPYPFPPPFGGCPRRGRRPHWDHPSGGVSAREHTHNPPQDQAPTRVKVGAMLTSTHSVTCIMSLKASLVEPYMSINSMEEVVFPNFTVLTGKNGAGKTHLLKAIADRKVSVIDLESSKHLTHIAYFPPGQPMVTDTSAPMEHRFPVSHPENPSYNIWQQIMSLRSSYRPRPMIMGSTPQIGLRDYILSNARSMGINPKLLQKLEVETGVDITQVDQKILSDYIDGIKLISNPFTLDISQNFMSYHRLLSRNQYNQFLASKGEDAEFLSDTDFEKKYGASPLEAANEILQLMGLDYTFAPITSRSHDYIYQANLIDSSGLKINLSDLSSGERTLFSIAMSAYAASRWEDHSVFPDLILFDEVDSSLHPDMISRLFNIVKHVLIDRVGCKVIMSTHSPSTVALAPEGSTYTISRGKVITVRRISTDEAIASLISGVPTLSVKIENRRQVFVESGHDELIYSEIFERVKSITNPTVSLNFIRIGHNKNGGCAELIRQVEALRLSGNNTVHGIIDWDGKNEPLDKIHVAGHGERYSIENFIFDPFLFGYYLLKNQYISPANFGLEPEEGFLEFINPSHTKAQRLADAVVSFFYDLQLDKVGERLAYLYSNDVTIDIPKRYMETNGHEIESAWKEKIPSLKRFHQEPSLKLDVVRHSFTDNKGYIPKQLIAIFKDIQSATS